MGEVGCYSMDLYCDSPRHNHNLRVYDGAQFTGRNVTECRRDARKAGWVIRRNGKVATLGCGTVTCPACARRPAPGEEGTP